MQDLICVSHLRWDFVWQRPQHLIARIAQTRRVFFVEEPIAVPANESLRLDSYEWRGTNDESVTVLRLMQPMEHPRWIGHGDALTEKTYCDMLNKELARHGVGDPLLWLYTPMADGFIEALKPSTVVYDVMDQLSAFKDASPELTERDRALLRRADVVLTGGSSLYRDKLPYNPNTYLFPSGVEVEHFAGKNGIAMPEDLRTMPRPILGYFGVIDERMDLELLAEMVEQHPEWSIVMIGPVTKIDFDDLPHAPNLHYLGMRAYGELPSYLAHFDVALIPFAMNEATRYLSPTKTLEYMAAHKPIVSTPIPDVIELYGDVVRVGYTHKEFISHIEAALRTQDTPERAAKEHTLLAENTWDAIARNVMGILDRQLA
jgi:glycosyltransferase involved in cell wall biosynthesis